MHVLAQVSLLGISVLDAEFSIEIESSENSGLGEGWTGGGATFLVAGGGSCKAPGGLTAATRIVGLILYQSCGVATMRR